MKISVLSQNVMCWRCPGGQFAERRERMKRLFRRLDPDLIGFQEVTELWKSYFDEDLSGYENVFKYRGADDLEAVPLYYKLDKFDLVDSGWFWLSETPDVESNGPGAGYPRITSWAILGCRDGGERLLFIDTHLDYASAAARDCGVKTILRFIDEKSGGLPVVLTGDFNDVSYSAPVEEIKKTLSDSRLAARETTEMNTHSSRFGEPGDASIDYIFTRGCRVLTYSVEKEADGPYPQSDHYGVFVTAELKNE